MKAAIQILLLILCFPAVGRADDTSATPDEPFYRLLYEQGFYDEAIALLDSLAAADTSGNRELLLYLASSYIARGDADSGASVFRRMLAADPAYRLDTIMTPPKILEVFRNVRNEFETRTAPPDTVKTEPDSGAPEPVAAVVDSPDTGAVSSLALPGADRSIEGPHPVLRYSFGILPGGAGQFFQRKPIRGALILAAQIGAAAGCYWAYRTRESYRHSRYVWYDGNREAYERYTGYARLGIGVAIGSYTFGLFDYFLMPPEKQ
jgi:hypothetical protein